ncbi:outer membrane beta-barrel protein [bacterium SCSIO 12741]|nr:outer membrane beta-barrel protein [bacterium SCSIO 12741]
MNEKDWIDKLYNSYFQESEVPFDEGHWKQFEADYLVNKKSKPFAWIAMGALVLASAGSALWLTNSDVAAPAVLADAQASQNNQVISSPKADQSFAQVSDETTSFTDAQNASNSNQPTESLANNSNQTENIETHSPGQSGGIGSHVPVETSSDTGMEPNPSSVAPSSENQPEPTSTTIAAAAHVGGQTSVASEQASSVNSTQTERTDVSSEMGSNLSLLSPRTSGLFAVPLQGELYNPGLSNTEAAVAPARYARKMDWFAEYYASANQLNRTSVSGSGINHQSISDFQMEDGYAFNTGIRVGTKVKDFLFMTGIGYRYENQKFSWNYHYDETKTVETITNETIYTINTNDTLPLVVNENGKWVQVIRHPDTTVTQISDTVSQEITDSYVRALKSHLRTHYVEVPLLVGYELEKGKLGFQAVGGVIPKVLAGSKGANYTSEGVAFPLNLGDDILNPVALDYQVQARVMYRFFPQWRVFAGAQYRGNLTSAYKNSSPIIYKHSGLGLSCGIRLDF